MRSPSGTEMNGSESRQLDPPQATMPSSENRSITEREERRVMSEGERLVNAFWYKEMFCVENTKTRKN